MNERIERITKNLMVKNEKGGFDTCTLQERLEYYHTTAFTFACIDNYEIDFTYAFGTKVLNGTELVDDSTPFMAASVSKVITAVAAMMLVQQGVLELDRDVNEYFSDYVIPAAEGLSNRVTLRQIFGHLGGVNCHGFGGYQIGAQLPTLLQVLKGEAPAKNVPVMVINQQDSYISTETDWEGGYSGGGLCLAQKVMCDVTGKPFEQLMDELVLKPFGMSDSTFWQPGTVQHAATYTQRPPVGYNPTRGGVRLDHYEPVTGLYYVELAAGGMWSTSRDLAKFGVRLLHILRDDDCPLLSRENLKQMLVLQKHSENGIGFYIYPTMDPDVFMFAHTGCCNGFMSMAYYLSDGRGVTLMVNSNEGMDLFYELPRAIIQEYGYPLPLDFTN